MTTANILLLLGIIYLALGLGALIDRKLIKNTLNSLADSVGLLVVCGMMVLALGFVLVTFYNVWEWKLALAVTIIGWLCVIKGSALLLFPQRYANMAKKIAKKEWMLGAATLVIVILGLVFIYLGTNPF